MKKMLKAYDKLFDLWMKFHQTIRYLLVGGFNTCVFYLFFVYFVLWLGEEKAQLALFLAFIISSFSSYFTQRTFVFLSNGNYKNEYIKCFVTWGFGYFCNAALLALFIEYLGLNPYVGELIAIILTTCTTYLLLKHFAFRKKVLSVKGAR